MSNAIEETTESESPSVIQNIARLGLGALLLLAGLSHLTWSRTEFQAQVPGWLPLDADFVVVASGIVELLIGAALVLAPRYRVLIGLIAAGFFVAIFPGNLWQFIDGVEAFGLDSDLARGVRLLFQPVLVAWALWSTGAWSSVRAAAS